MNAREVSTPTHGGSGKDPAVFGKEIDRRVRYSVVHNAHGGRPYAFHGSHGGIKAEDPQHGQLVQSEGPLSLQKKLSYKHGGVTANEKINLQRKGTIFDDPRVGFNKKPEGKIKVSVTTDINKQESEKTDKKDKTESKDEDTLEPDADFVKYLADKQIELTTDNKSGYKMYSNQLPYGWRVCFDFNSKRYYFVHDSTRTKSWYDPRPLPPGWELAMIPRSKKYYFQNTVTKETTWEDPRPPLEPGNSSSLSTFFGIL